MKTRKFTLFTAALAGALFLGGEVAAQRAGADDTPATRDAATQDADRQAQRPATGQAERTPPATREGQAAPRGAPEQRAPGAGTAQRQPADGGATRTAPARPDRAQIERAAAQMAQEESTHRRHMAKIVALRRHFEAKGQADQVRQIDELQSREMGRYDERMERARQGLGDERYRQLRQIVETRGQKPERLEAFKKWARENPERAKHVIQQHREGQAAPDAGAQRDGTRGDTDAGGQRDGTRGDTDAGGQRDGSRGNPAPAPRGGNASGGTRDGNAGGGARGGNGDGGGNRGGNDRDGRGGRGGGR